MRRRRRIWPRKRCLPSGAGLRSTPRTRAARRPGSLPSPATCASTGCAARCPGRSCPRSGLEGAAGEALPDEALAEKERQVRVRAALASLPPEQQRGGGALLSRRPVARRDRRAPGAAAGHRQVAHAHRLPEDPRRRSRTCDDHHASPRRRDADELRRRRAARLRCPPWRPPMSPCAPAAAARSRRSSASAAPLLAELSPATLERAEPPRRRWRPRPACARSPRARAPTRRVPDGDMPRPLARLARRRSRCRPLAVARARRVASPPAADGRAAGSAC